MSSMICIRCPVTDRAVATGILMTRTAFRTKNTDVRCPACSGVHSWQRVDAWLARLRYPIDARAALKPKSMLGGAGFTGTIGSPIRSRAT